jgi:multisubunit Na+/H+ antiporter MnhB subunit
MGRKKSGRESGSVAAQGIAVVAFSFVLYFFGHEAGWFEEIPHWLDNRDVFLILVVILIIALVVAYVMRSDSEYLSKD